MKTDLKVGFQAAVCNAMDAMHAGHVMQIKKLQCTQCMHRKNATDTRIESVACVALFAYVSCIFFFWLCRKPCVHCVAYVAYDSLETACRPVGHMYVSVLNLYTSAMPGIWHQHEHTNLDGYFRRQRQESDMAGNYVIVADFCDRAGPFLKFEKNSHIAARKLRFRFRSALKPAVFGLITVTALCFCHWQLKQAGRSLLDNALQDHIQHCRRAIGNNT